MSDPQVVLQALAEACDTVEQRIDELAKQIAHERKNIDQLFVSLQVLRQLGEEVFKIEEDQK